MENITLGMLFDKLIAYGKSDFYPYHMPGHKRQVVQGFPSELVQADITEISDCDNLHQPEGILLEAQKQAAEAYGAQESFFLINGSTCGILSAVSAAVPFGGHILIARNCHKSVYHAAYLRKLRLSYIYPSVMREYDICEAVTARQVEEAFLREENAAKEASRFGGQEKSSIQAVLIVSPTYEGRIADIKAIAEVVHARGIPLIVDEAHGAHLGFAEGFAVNSCRLGADIVINSVHKTMPAMTQTALLHCNGSLIDRDVLKRFLHIYQSSSPSYILMASIEQAVRAGIEGKAAFAEFRQQWYCMLERLQGLKKLKILPRPDTQECILAGCRDFQKGQHHDIGKLIISTKDTEISGKQLADVLRDAYHLEVEMACQSYVLAMFTVSDIPRGYDRLVQALLEIDQKLDGKERASLGEEAPDNRLENQVLHDFYRAWDCPKTEVVLEDAVGCVAGEFINLYPPGTPIVVPGEVINRQTIDRIRTCLLAGLEVQGVRQVRDNRDMAEQMMAEQNIENQEYERERTKEYVITVLK